MSVELTARAWGYPVTVASVTGWHWPAMHVPPRQLCPQTPQLLASVWVFAHDAASFAPSRVSPPSPLSRSEGPSLGGAESNPAAPSVGDEPSVLPVLVCGE